MSPRQMPSIVHLREVFVDSSGIFALLDRTDVNHQAAVMIFENLSRAGTRLVFTNFVRAEAHALVLNRLGHMVAGRLLSMMRTSATSTLIRVTEADETAALDLIARYRDKRFSLTDATSFVVMERLGMRHAVSFDSDFRQYGWTLLTPT